jgi:hypothetical protein
MSTPIQMSRPLIATCLVLAGCSHHAMYAPPPQDLLTAVVEAAKTMPAGLRYEVDDAGNAQPGTPPYFVVTRLVRSGSDRHELWQSTNVVQEWVNGIGYGSNEVNYISELKKRNYLERAAYRVGFTINQWSQSNALVSVTIAYPDRGGHSCQWEFANHDGHWVRIKDRRTSSWD